MSTPTMFDTPPHSPEAEKTVLGALLLDPEAIVKISDFLLPSDFYDPTFREIYQAVFDLYVARADRLYYGFEQTCRK
jgi:replicative DNA helicase